MAPGYTGTQRESVVLTWAGRHLCVENGITVEGYCLADIFIDPFVQRSDVSFSQKFLNKIEIISRPYNNLT